MAITLDSVKRGGELKAPIDLIYAPQGMGKTTLAAGAPNPIFLQTEDGLGVLDTPTFGLLRSYSDVKEAIKQLIIGEHNYRTVVLDSVGWLQPLIWAQICLERGWKDIEEPGYGKGPIAALGLWQVMLDGFSRLRDQRGMGVILLAHSDVKKVEPPDGEDYERYQPLLHKGAADLILQYADGVYFINTRVSITRSEQKNKNSRGIAVGSNQRFMYTTLKASHVAKNRWTMPEMIPLPVPPPGQPADPFTTFVAMARYVPYYARMMQAAVAAPPPVDVSAESTEKASSPFDAVGGEEAETGAGTETNETNNATA